MGPLLSCSLASRTAPFEAGIDARLRYHPPACSAARAAYVCSSVMHKCGACCAFLFRNLLCSADPRSGAVAAPIEHRRPSDQWRARAFASAAPFAD